MSFKDGADVRFYQCIKFDIVSVGNGTANIKLDKLISQIWSDCSRDQSNDEPFVIIWAIG